MASRWNKGDRLALWLLVSDNRPPSQISCAPAGTGPVFLRSGGHLSFTSSRYDIRRMSSDYDPWRQAEAAMREAVHARGFEERQRWIRLAQVWLELARDEPSVDLPVARRTA